MLTLLTLAAIAQPAAPTPPAPQERSRTIIISTDRGGETVRTERSGGGGGEREEVIVLRNRGEGAREPRVRIFGDSDRRGERREVTIIRENGTGGERGSRVSVIGGCDGDDRFESSTESDKDGKKVESRVVVCSRGGNRLEALERVSKRLSENKELPADLRSRVLSQVEAEIARLKAGK